MRVAVANIQLVTTPKAAVLEFIFTPCNFHGIPEHSWKTAGCPHRSDNPLKLLIRIRDSPIYLWFQILSNHTNNCKLFKINSKRRLGVYFHFSLLLVSNSGQPPQLLSYGVL